MWNLTMKLVKPCVPQHVLLQGVSKYIYFMLMSVLYNFAGCTLRIFAHIQIAQVSLVDENLCTNRREAGSQLLHVWQEHTTARSIQHVPS